MAKDKDLEADKNKALDLCIRIAATARGKRGNLDISDMNYIIREASSITERCMKREGTIA